MTPEEFRAVLERTYASRPWPRPLSLLIGADRVRAGEPSKLVAKDLGTLRRRLESLAEAGNPVATALGLPDLETTERERARAEQILGQMLLGRCAELAFEDIYRFTVDSEEFALTDITEARTDTDYRILNGKGRNIFRTNIKFHGSTFRQAKQWVGLEPADCFALATYKINSALKKQEDEHLPYFFAVVGVPGLTGATTGTSLGTSEVAAVVLVHRSRTGVRKRDFEDAIVQRQVAEDTELFQETFRRIRLAPWYVLSARKADMLMRSMLFERVFALRVRGFARVFRGAELDMHYSLEQDLTPLETFLRTLRAEGLQKVVGLMERGVF